MKKNVSGQVIGCQLVSKTDGSAVTSGTTTIYVTGDGGTQAAGSVSSGACTHEGNGFWTYAPAQAETNYDHIGFTFVNTSACNVSVQVYTGFPQTGDSFARIGAPVGASISADIAGVQADTDNIQTRIPAALVSGRMDASVGAMATDVITAAATAADFKTEVTSGLSTLDAAGVRTAVGLASANLDTQLTTIDDFLDTEVAAIKAKTDNLPSDPADASDIAASFSTVNSTLATLATAANLATVAGYIDTEVAAIKAKTDNLPSSPAATGDAMTLTSAYDFAKGTVAMTEAYANDGSTATPIQMLYMLWALSAERGIAGTTMTVKKLDGSTTAMTFTLDSASAPTSLTRAT